MRDVVHGAIPANANVICSRTVLAADIGDRIGHVRKALLQFARTAIDYIRLERRLDRRKHGAVQPRRRATAGIEAGFEVLGADRMEVVVLDVVRPRPGYFDRRPEHLRQQRRLRDVIGLDFLPKPPPSKVTCTVTSLSCRPSTFATVVL